MKKKPKKKKINKKKKKKKRNSKRPQHSSVEPALGTKSNEMQTHPISSTSPNIIPLNKFSLQKHLNLKQISHPKN